MESLHWILSVLTLSVPSWEVKTQLELLTTLATTKSPLSPNVSKTLEPRLSKPKLVAVRLPFQWPTLLPDLLPLSFAP